MEDYEHGVLQNKLVDLARLATAFCRFNALKKLAGLKATSQWHRSEPEIVRVNRQVVKPGRCG